jgi:hypothetical protein
VSRFVQEELAVNLTDDGSMRALIYAESTEPEISNSGDSMLAIFSTQQVPYTWMEILQGIASGRWPAGFVPQTPNSFLFNFYPKEMQDFCISAVERLKDQLREFYGLMRWRLHDNISPGAHITSGQVEWSNDGHAWHRLRMVPRYSGKILPQINLSPAVKEALDDVVHMKLKEPLGREIWHVARKEADPRTAVILAVTAVEVEVKRLISEFVPDSEWLVANLPSPPAFRLIKTYLPMIINIPTNQIPPKNLIKSLQAGIELRNTFVHGGLQGWGATSDLSPDQVEEVMTTSSDLLWLFDLYRGHSWAVSYLSEETRRTVERTSPDSAE